MHLLIKEHLKKAVSLTKMIHMEIIDLHFWLKNIKSQVELKKLWNFRECRVLINITPYLVLCNLIWVEKSHSIEGCFSKVIQINKLIIFLIMWLIINWEVMDHLFHIISVKHLTNTLMILIALIIKYLILQPHVNKLQWTNQTSEQKFRPRVRYLMITLKIWLITRILDSPKSNCSLGLSKTK